MDSVWIHNITFRRTAIQFTTLIIKSEYVFGFIKVGFRKILKKFRKVDRKIAVTFLSDYRFLRSIPQNDANYPYFTMRHRPERIGVAFGPSRQKSILRPTCRRQKSARTFDPPFLSAAWFRIPSGPLPPVSLFAHVPPTDTCPTRVAPISGVGPSSRTFVCKIMKNSNNVRIF